MFRSIKYFDEERIKILNESAQNKANLSESFKKR